MRKNQQIDFIGAAAMCIVQNNKGKKHIRQCECNYHWLAFHSFLSLSVAPLDSSFHCLQNMNTSIFA